MSPLTEGAEPVHVMVWERPTGAFTVSPGICNEKAILEIAKIMFVLPLKRSLCAFTQWRKLFLLLRRLAFNGGNAVAA